MIPSLQGGNDFKHNIIYKRRQLNPSEVCAFSVFEPHPYKESPYAAPHKVSIPEECPMAENIFRIASAEGRPARLLTAGLKWHCTEQSRKARLITLVSNRREIIYLQRDRANGWFSFLRRMSPASTPHRKSSPLGVRPIPSPVSPARLWAASPYMPCSRYIPHWRI